MLLPLELRNSKIYLIERYIIWSPVVAMVACGRLWSPVVAGGRRWSPVVVGGRRWSSVVVGGRHGDHALSFNIRGL